MGRDMVVSRYAIPIGVSLVDGLSTESPGFGVSHLSYGASWKKWKKACVTIVIESGALPTNVRANSCYCWV